MICYNMFFFAYFPGSFMFKAIEGGATAERKENAEKTRNETVNKLWDISCCVFNVFNKTTFTEA